MDFFQLLSDSEACRACLDPKSESVYLVSIDALESDAEEHTIRHKLSKCVPDMDLNVTPNAVICINCLSMINLILEFKKICSLTEKCIHNYIRKIRASKGNVIGSIQQNEQVKQEPEEMISADESLIDTLYVYTSDLNEIEQQEDEVVDLNNVETIVEVDSTSYLDVTEAECALKIEQTDVEVIADMAVFKFESTSILQKTVTEYTSNAEETESTSSTEETESASNTQEAESASKTKVELDFDEIEIKDEPLDDALYLDISKSNENKQMEENFEVVELNNLEEAAEDDFALRIDETEEENCEEFELKLSEEETEVEATQNADVPEAESALNVQSLLSATQKAVDHNEESNNFVCNESGEHTTSEAELISHLKVHVKQRNVQKKYNCRSCNYKTDSRRHLQRHVKRHKKKSLFKCAQCKYVCTKEKSLDFHVRIHNRGKSYKCTSCAYRTWTSDLFLAHMRKHTDNRVYKCNSCDHNATSESDFVAHLQIHKPNKRFQCTVCKYKCNRIGTLNVHMRIHRGESSGASLAVDTKGSSLKNTETDDGVIKMLLSKQISTWNHAKSDYPYKCTLCDFKSQYKYEVIAHMSTHVYERPYKCSECSFSTTSQVGLTIHKNMHIEKKYTCGICTYKSKCEDALNRHMRKHSSETLYKCLECLQICRDSKGLDAHTIEKPYICNECNCKFCKKENLDKHMYFIHTANHVKISIVPTEEMTLYYWPDDKVQ